MKKMALTVISLWYVIVSAIIGLLAAGLIWSWLALILAPVIIIQIARLISIYKED